MAAAVHKKPPSAFRSSNYTSHYLDHMKNDYRCHAPLTIPIHRPLNRSIIEFQPYAACTISPHLKRNSIDFEPRTFITRIINLVRTCFCVIGLPSLSDRVSITCDADDLAFIVLLLRIQTSVASATNGSICSSASSCAIMPSVALANASANPFSELSTKIS